MNRSLSNQAGGDRWVSAQVANQLAAERDAWAQRATQLEQHLRRTPANRADPALNDELRRLREALASANATLAAHQDGLASANASLTAHRDALANANASLTAHRDALANANRERAALQDALANAEERALRSEYPAASDDHRSRSELPALRDALANANHEHATLREALATANSERAALQNALATANAERAALQEALANADQARLREPNGPHRDAANPEELLRLRHRESELLADLDRTKRNTERDIDRAVRAERSARLTELLETYDGLLRALTEQQDRQSAWYQGQLGLLRQLRATLSRLDLTEFARAGDPFDPALHEAIATEPSPTLAPNHLARVERTGFRYPDGTLLRPAQVVVSI